MIEVISYQDWRAIEKASGKIPKDQIVETVSKSKTWSKGLSPFVLGPCKLWNLSHQDESVNMENAWQFSKVYPEHVDDNGDPTYKYYEWAISGWQDWKAHRYPMGKGAIPLYSYWNNQKLNYVEARKQIYIPLYYDAVKDTVAFNCLIDIHNALVSEGKTLYLVDYDAYRHKQMGKSYKDVINDPNKKMGHAFVLAMALEIPEKLEKAIRRKNGNNTNITGS